MPDSGYDHFGDIRLVYLNESLSLKEKMVLLCLIYHRNSKTGRCFPSQRTIGRECGMSQSTVSRTLKKLYALGLVANVSRKNQPPSYILGLSVMQYMNNALEGISGLKGDWSQCAIL